MPTRYRGKRKTSASSFLKSPGNIRGTRRAISEIVKWMNYVTDNRFVIVAADLADSINVENGSLWGHYDPVTNPLGTRLKAWDSGSGQRFHRRGIRRAIGVAGPQGARGSLGHSRHLRGVHALDVPAVPGLEPAEPGQPLPGGRAQRAGRTFGAGKPLPTPRTHFGIFSPQVWKLFPKGQAITLSFWDYNDVAAGYFAAAEVAARDPKVGIIVLEVARPGLSGGGPEQIRGPRPESSRQGLLRHSGLRSGQTQTWLRADPRVVFHGQPGIGTAAIGVGRRQRESSGRHQRRTVPVAAGELPGLGIAPRRGLRPDGGDHRHPPYVAVAAHGTVDRRVFAGIGLGQPMADRGHGSRRHHRSPPGRRVHLPGNPPVSRWTTTSELPARRRC